MFKDSNAACQRQRQRQRYHHLHDHHHHHYPRQLDGVDEAAGLASVIEREVLEQLLPAGFQVVVTSRPEGIMHPDRWADKCVIMNLRPLTHEQQMHLVKQQVGS